ncbi:MAG TPA: hypothetical protein VLM85_22060 [Polyangiaceae bacterium]|nr:hypothetical protein [Polyangiaceae bacterium]
MMRSGALVVLLVACHAPQAAVVSLAPVDASAPPHEVAPAPEPKSDDLEWRIVAKKFVEDPNGGLPKEMWVKVELRFAGERIASFDFQDPDCNEGPPDPNEKLVARLECYYAGGGDYVDVFERVPNDFEVVSYQQSESYEDEPNPPKDGVKVVAQFRARGPITTRLVDPDGGARRSR